MVELGNKIKGSVDADTSKLLGCSVAKGDVRGKVTAVSPNEVTIVWEEVIPQARQEAIKTTDFGNLSVLKENGDEFVMVPFLEEAKTPHSILAAELEEILRAGEGEAPSVEDASPDLLGEASNSKGAFLKKGSKKDDGGFSKEGGGGQTRPGPNVKGKGWTGWKKKGDEKKSDKKTEKPAEKKAAGKGKAKGNPETKSKGGKSSHTPSENQSTNGPSGVPPYPPRKNREVGKTGQWKCTRAGKLRQICTYLPTGRKKTVVIKPGYRKGYNKAYKKLHGH